MCNLHRCFWTLCVVAFLTCIQVGNAIADSPPNIAQDIAWFGDPDSIEVPQAYDSVEDIEAAFNNGRRQEEIQLELTTNTLGALDLPEQAVWDSLTMQQKALILINAERTARNEMLPNVKGLPLAGIETNLNTLAQQYAQILVDANTFTHTQPWPGAPSIDTINERIQNTPVIGGCNEFVSYNENLAAFWTTLNSIPLTLERSIYIWIYADAGSTWLHREGLFLQDADLGFNGSNGGFTNNLGSNAHEGFLGIGLVGSASYTVGNPIWNWGEAIVMEVIDPIANTNCPTSAGPSAITLSIQRTTPPVVAVGAPVSFALQLSNVGETVLTDIELTDTFDTDLLDFVALSALTISQPTAPAQSVPANQLSVNDAAGTVTITDLDGLLPSAVLNPIQSIDLTLDFVATAHKNLQANALVTQNEVAGSAKGGWGGTVTAAVVNANVEVVAPIINEIDSVLFATQNNEAVAGTAEFIELKNPSTINIPLGEYEILLIQQTSGEDDTESVYRTIALPQESLAPGEYFVLCTDAALVSQCDFTIPTSAEENGNLILDAQLGAVALVYKETILDAVSYGGSAIGPYVEGSASAASDDDETVLISLSRFPDGVDSENNQTDWSRRCATPGLANVSNDSDCGPNLIVTITADPQMVAPGATVNYTIGYTNTGFVAARNSVLVGEFPQQLEALTLSSSSGPLAITVDPNGVTGSADLLPVGASGSIVVRGTVALNLAGGTQLPASISLLNPVPNNVIADSTSSINLTIVNVAPVGVNDTVAIDEDSDILPDLLVNDTDLNGDTLAFTSVYTNSDTSNQSTLGIVQLGVETVTYRPGPNFQYLAVDESATDFFGYVLDDGVGLTATATVAITVLGVNDPPLAFNDAFTTTADSRLMIPRTRGLLINDSDPDLSDSLTITESSSESQKGAALSVQPTGQFSYDPTNDIALFRTLAEGQATTDLFTYTIADESDAADVGEVLMTVVGVNDPPQTEDDLYETDEDTLLTVEAPGLLANDSDIDQGDALSITVATLTSPSGSNIVIQADGGMIFDPTSALLVQALSVGEVMTETYTYSVQDLAAATTKSNVTIVVNGINDPPLAVADQRQMDEDNVLIIDVLTNDSDPDSRDFTRIDSVGEPVNGTISISDDGQVLTYAPTLNFHGEDIFTYTIIDAGALVSTAVVTVVVLPVNDAPIFTESTPALDVTVGSQFSYTTRATDVDAADSLTLRARQLPAWLQIVDHGDGSATISGTPAEGDVGIQNIVWEASDGLLTVQSTISFEVRSIQMTPNGTPPPTLTSGPSPTSGPSSTPVPTSIPNETPVPAPTSGLTSTPQPTSAPTTSTPTASSTPQPGVTPDLTTPVTQPTANMTAQPTTTAPSQTPIGSETPTTPVGTSTPVETPITAETPTGQNEQSLFLPLMLSQ